MKAKLKLSILICTITKRISLLTRLLGILQPQLTDEVEVIYIGDNKKRTIGEKRNNLLNLAQGDFLTFIDDDDRVEMDYVSSILKAITKDADCIVFDTSTNHPDGIRKRNKVGIEYDYTETNNLVTCKPSHTMVWRTSLAKSEQFPERSEGEDVDWVSRVWPKIKKQVRIDKLLYQYDFNMLKSER